MTAATVPLARLSDAPDRLANALAYFLRRASPRILLGALAVALVARVAAAGFTAWDVVPPLAGRSPTGRSRSG